MRPLERMAGQQILVLPVQYLSVRDSLGWQQQIPDRAALLATLDDQIEAASLPAASARRGLRTRCRARLEDEQHTDDGRAIPFGGVAPRTSVPEAAVRDPLASQVRGLVGLKGSVMRFCPWSSGSRIAAVVQALRFCGS